MELNTLPKYDMSEDDFIVLSYDPSPWRGEHYFAATKCNIYATIYIYNNKQDVKKHESEIRWII